MKNLETHALQIKTALECAVYASKNFKSRPDMTLVAVAIHDLLVDAGLDPLAASKWETDERQQSKIT